VAESGRARIAIDRSRWARAALIRPPDPSFDESRPGATQKAAQRGSLEMSDEFVFYPVDPAEEPEEQSEIKTFLARAGLSY
jgi:hypothetical protein